MHYKQTPRRGLRLQTVGVSLARLHYGGHGETTAPAHQPVASLQFCIATPALAHSSTVVRYWSTPSLPMTYGCFWLPVRWASAGSFVLVPSKFVWFAMMTSAPACAAMLRNRSADVA